jgi:hypothetical protein
MDPLKKIRSFIITSVVLFLPTITARTITIKNMIPQAAEIKQVILDHQQIQSGDLYGRSITQEQQKNINGKTTIPRAQAVIDVMTLNPSQTVTLNTTPNEVSLQFNYANTKPVIFTIVFSSDVCLEVNDKAVSFCPPASRPLRATKTRSPQPRFENMPGRQ